MDKLPDSLLMLILPIIGHFCELNNIAAVCKRWHRAMKKAYHYISFSGTFYPKNMPHRIDLKFYFLLFRENLKILSLNLKSTSLYSQDRILALARLLASQPWLEVLDLTNAIIQPHKLWKNLIKLKLKNTFNLYSLHTLKITNNRRKIGFKQLTELLPNLKRLYIGNTDIALKDFIEIITKLKKLELLDLSYCRNLKLLEEYSVVSLLQNSSLKVIFTHTGELFDFLRSQSLSHTKIISMTIENILWNIESPFSLAKLEKFLNSGGDVNLFDFGKKRNTYRPLLYPQFDIIRKRIDENLMVEIYKILIRHGLDLSFYVFHRYSYVNLAIQYEYTELLKLFMHVKADVFFPGAPEEWKKIGDDVPWYCPSIIYASHCENYSAWNLFLNYGLEKIDYYSIRFEENCNMWCIAARKDDNECLEYLQDRFFPYFPCPFNDHWDTISNKIKKRISEGEIEKLKHFPDFFIYYVAWSLLWENEIKSSKRIIKYFSKKFQLWNENKMLMRIGDYIGKKRWTLIMIAVDKDNFKMILYLVKKGFDINLSAWDGNRPLTIAACQSYCTEMVEYLMNLGAR